MRAPRRRQVGAIAQTGVTYTFEFLGWGVVPVPWFHDLGTDLFVPVRDEDLVEEGLVFGVQVKGGRRCFRDPLLDADGEVQGWWFRPDRRAHADY